MPQGIAIRAPEARTGAIELRVEPGEPIAGERSRERAGPGRLEHEGLRYHARTGAGDGMREVRLADINMNLLLALEALLAEVSVTRAAKRLHISQSAMSHNLAQLRELLGEPLLIRGHGGMALTPRAQALVAPLRFGLRQLQRALSEEATFDPASTTRGFTLAMGDFVAVLLIPPLLQRLRVAAPGITLEVAAIDRRRNAELLESGEHDLAVSVRFEAAPCLVIDPLIVQRFVCVVRDGHPEIAGTLSIEQYERWPHVLVGTRRDDSAVVDTMLRKLGRTRRVAVRVPYFLAAPVMVAASDLILTTAHLVAAHFARMYPLQVLTPPIDLHPFGIDAAWHERFDHDPAHRWLRGQVAEVMRGFA